MNRSFLQRTILVFIVFVLSCSISYGHDIEMLGSSEEVKVEGTELSRLHSVMDVDFAGTVLQSTLSFQFQ